MALSGTISGSYRGWTVESRWSASQNVGGNYSDITVNHYLVLSSSYSLNIGSRTNSCTVNGETKNFTSGSINQRGGSVLLGTTSYRVYHNADGTKSCSLSTTFNVQATLSGSYISAISASGTITLNTIPRAATATSVANFDDTANPVLKYSNPAGNSVTSLQACIAATDGQTIYVAYRDISKTGSSYTFNLTDAERNTLRSQIPNSKTLNVRVYVKTVLGGNTSYSYATATMTIVSANPTFSVAYLDTNSTVTAITENNQKIVQNKSTLRINVSNASAKKYATLTTASCTVLGTNYSANISNGAATLNIGTVNSSSNLTIAVKVTDSRGNSTTTNVNVQVLAWQLPTAIITNQRQNNFYSNTDIKVDADYSSVDNKNTITIQLRYKKTSASTWSSYTTMQDNVAQTFSLDNEFEWNVQVKLIDRFGNTTYNIIIPRGMPIVYFDVLKSSVGFNCFPKFEKSVEVNGIPVIKNIMTRTLSAEITNLAVNTYTIVPLNTSNASGSLLTTTNSGGIKIGAGVSKIMVSGRIAFGTIKNAANRHLRIMKGSSYSDTNTLGWVWETIPVCDCKTMAITPMLVDVAEGDEIYLYYYTSYSADKIGGNSRGGRTSLTVEVVA